MAEEEAQGLRAEAMRAMRLEDQSGTLYDVATDAIEAYQRARDRAESPAEASRPHRGRLQRMRGHRSKRGAGEEPAEESGPVTGACAKSEPHK